MGAKHLPCLPPPDDPIIRLEAEDAAGGVRHLARARNLVGRPGKRVADAHDKPEHTNDGDERCTTEEATNDVSPATRH